jgi:Uma2 family endonuclease
MTTASQLVTAEQLLGMPPGEPCELIAGEVVMMTPAGGEHGAIAAEITRLLGNHAVRDRLGIVYSGEAGFVITRDPDTVRVPDVAFVRRDRQATPPRGFVPGAPDLVVEVISPTDRMADVDTKTHAWLEGGAGIVWIVLPDTRSVIVHRTGRPPRILNAQDIITGEEVLPGFQCRVAEFFDA